ncbi:MAG: hypothetical protein P8X96_09525 [Desulfobacteraceae bacterium]|jgi:hypothetical protein
METMKIQSGMPHFKIVSKIFDVSPNNIDAQAVFGGDPIYTGLEAMAQTAALHVRHSLRFERHAFLLSVHHCQLPDLDALEGPFRIKAALHGRSSEAFVYKVAASGPHGADFDAELLIGTCEYDERFRKASLIAHYQEIWTRLREV